MNRLGRKQKQDDTPMEFHGIGATASSESSNCVDEFEDDIWFSFRKAFVPSSLF